MKSLNFLIIASMFLCSTSALSQEKLEIGGAIIIKDSEDPTPVPGTIRFNTTSNDFEGWNGLFWVSLGGFQFDIGEVIDQDGNVYPTVKIGTQEWMATNLRTTKYLNDDPITFIENDSAGMTAWRTADYGAYSKYDTLGTGYASYDVSKFGYLYNWYAVDDTRKLCPTGWHEPRNSEWTKLTDFLGVGAGGSMKEAGTAHWNSPNTGATNASGFTGLPGGNRRTTGYFVNHGKNGLWWSSTESFSSAWYRVLIENTVTVGGALLDKSSGFSVRCVRN